jgi:hypothetical protein
MTLSSEWYWFAQLGNSNYGTLSSAICGHSCDNVTYSISSSGGCKGYDTLLSGGARQSVAGVTTLSSGDSSRS